MIHKRRFESDKGDLPSPNIPGLSKVPVECSKQDNPEDAEEKNSCVTNSVICAPFRELQLLISFQKHCGNNDSKIQDLESLSI